MNPNQDSDILGWENISIEYGELSYEFDTLIFWKTKTDEIYMAHDSGCSCPTPFEKYEGETENEIKQKLERVASIDQAKHKYDSRNVSEDSRPNKTWDEVRSRLAEWGLK